MNRDTMEYVINQTVTFYGEDMILGRLSDKEYAEMYATKWTGKITGHFGENFIISLDRALPDGSTTVLVPAVSCNPLNCHWCADTKKV